MVRPAPTVLGTVLLTLLGAPGAARAQLPADLSYQGLLLDPQGSPVAGPIPSVRLGLWDAESGGALVYLEEHTDVPASDGVFSLRIGGGAPLGGSVFGADLFDEGERYLEVSIDRGGGPETLAPRQKLTAVPYSIRSGSAKTLDKLITVGDEDGDLQLTGADIQAAIDAAGSGGIVLVPPGLYAVANPILIGDGIDLRGSSHSSVLQWVGCPGAVTSCSIIMNDNPSGPSGNARLAIRDLNLVGGGTQGGNGIWLRRVADVTLEGLRIENVGKAGIVIDEPQPGYARGTNRDLVVRENHIESTGTNDGITLVGERGRITGNTVIGATNHGIHLHADGENQDWVLANNLVQGALDHCLAVSHASGIAISGNRLRDCGASGIAVDGGALPAGNALSITGNVVSNAAGSGFNLSGALEIRDASVTGNLFENSGQYGIRVKNSRNVTVASNTLVATGWDGILFELVHHSTLAGNTIRRVGNACATSAIVCESQNQCSGIRLGSSSYINVSGNRIAHDLNSTPDMDFGLCVRSSEYVLVTGNLMRGPIPDGTFTGIFVDGASSPTVRRPRCSNLVHGESPDTCP